MKYNDFRDGYIDLGLYFLRTLSVNFWPKEPRKILSDSFPQMMVKTLGVLWFSKEKKQVGRYLAIVSLSGEAVEGTKRRLA